MSWLKKFLPVAQERPQGPYAGFQVLKNASNKLSAEPWFDFVCGINGRCIEEGNPYLFLQEVRNCAGRDVSFTIWSAKGQRTREIVIALPSIEPILGITLQWCETSITEDVWHILDIQSGSPADLAGLLPYSDYIIGTPEGIVRSESGLGELVEDHLDRRLRLYVYNHEYDVTRELEITPTRSWGGEGALGCVLGFGALHRLPAPLAEPVHAPGETLFESRSSTEEDALFPPAEPVGVATNTVHSHSFNLRSYPLMQQTTPNQEPRGCAMPTARSASHAIKPRPKPRYAQHVNLSAMNDYMWEEEQKSRDLESTETKVGYQNIPPPPRRAELQPASPPAGPHPHKEVFENDVD